MITERILEIEIVTLWNNLLATQWEIGLCLIENFIIEEITGQSIVVSSYAMQDM